MAVLKCKMCGGELAVADNSNICVCDYCGTKQTVPSARDEILSNLFNRANNLRLRSEFDKAQELYEKIVAENPNEAEAYWGIVLCKYGIEYVEDPATKTRIPTCHRTQLQSILADGDYKSAIANADVEQKSIYEEEAGRIDEIQKDILKIVHNEKPFDVFICYKETDESGKRTVDSSIANDIYHQLTQEGFKVFYAAITLEDKLGQEYEPYIFAALNSAKTMLVLGTKPEYFTAVWVRNEWSRFMKLMQNDRSKLLIPCYRDMDAYDLPEEFAHLQAQDMGKIGFINDIVRGIKKVTDEPKTEKKTAVVSEGNANIVALKKRGFMALEDGEWDKADSYFDDALNIDAEDAECYLGKLMAELQVKKSEHLKNCFSAFDSNNNYKKIMRFGNEKLKNELEGYLNFVKENGSAIAKVKYGGAKEELHQTIIGALKDVRKREIFMIVGWILIMAILFMLGSDVTSAMIISVIPIYAYSIWIILGSSKKMRKKTEILVAKVCLLEEDNLDEETKKVLTKIAEGEIVILDNWKKWTKKLLAYTDADTAQKVTDIMRTCNIKNFREARLKK